MNKPKPSLCDNLISRLEGSLANVRTPGSADLQQTSYQDFALGTHIDQSWQIFDQSSLHQMMFSDWAAQEQTLRYTLN
jgi:hypothetical protein